MGAGHIDSLVTDRPSAVHRLAAECKLAAHFAFVVAVVATPREAVPAFAAFAVLIVLVAASAGLGPQLMLRRMSVEVPFVAFAIFLPFVATGDRIDVAGVPLSVEGLWGAWNILAKATLGVAASVVLAATTPMADLLRGMHRLRVPAALVAVAGFAVRYFDVARAEMARMRIARESRGYEPRALWHARAVASGVGVLFVRSYERGERVHLAMMSRGYSGSVPRMDAAAPRTQWLAVAGFAAAAAAVAVIGS